MKRILACTLAVLAAFVVFGRVESDTVKVYFEVSRAVYDPARNDSGYAIDAFISQVRAAVDAQTLDSIIIRAYASPDGGARFNKRLSEERCDAIAALIIDRTGVSPDLIRTSPEGVAWDGLRQLVAETPETPYQQEVLDILDNTPVWIFNSRGHVIGGRKKKLMDLRGGRPYRWMLEHLFPLLRNSLAVSLYYVPDEPEEIKDLSDLKDSDDLNDLNALAPTDTIVAEPTDSVVAVPDSVIPEPVAPYIPRHRLALKTNIPYYAALLPNLELEWLITDRWSVAVEGNVAWWGSYAKERSYRLAIIDAEARHWIKPRSPWHGMYVGVIAGGGWYDLQKGNGKYGEGLMTGLSFGYMWPIGRNISLEAGLGLGYMYTRYKEYEPKDGHHVYMRTKELGYFGPIKLNFSVAWRFWDVNRSKPSNSRP